LLEWSLGAASDDHAALDGGLSARIGKRTAENSSFSLRVGWLSSDPVVVILSLENGLRDSWIAKFSRCAHLRTWGSAPPDQGTPSRTLTPVTLEGRRHPGSSAWAGASHLDVVDSPDPLARASRSGPTVQHGPDGGGSVGSRGRLLSSSPFDTLRRQTLLFRQLWEPTHAPKHVRPRCEVS